MASILKDQIAKATRHAASLQTYKELSQFDPLFVLWSDFGDFSADAIFSELADFGPNIEISIPPIFVDLVNIIRDFSNASNHLT